MPRLVKLSLAGYTVKGASIAAPGRHYVRFHPLAAIRRDRYRPLMGWLNPEAYAGTARSVTLIDACRQYVSQRRRPCF